MKKLFLTIVAVAVATATSLGQFKMSVGPFVGMNYSFYTGSDISLNNISVNGAGFVLGGHVDMQFTPIVGLLTSLTVFDGVGAKGSRTTNGVTGTMQFKTSYFMLNPSLKITVPRSGLNGSNGLSFLVGPGFGFKYTANYESYATSNGQRQQLQKKTDLPNTNPRIEALIGANYDFNLGGIILAPHITFNYGLNKVAEATEVRISYLQIGLACKFGLIK